MTIPLKEPLSFEDQIKNLREKHGLIVEDDAEGIRILQRVNYYRLRAYALGLESPKDRERYCSGISLNHIYRLYCFDSLLRGLMWPLLEEIEIELRTNMAYHLAMTYGADGYMDVHNFHDTINKNGKSVHAETIEKFHTEVKRRESLPCVKHHMEKYGGRFPAWAAVELFSFGMLSSLYSVMKRTDQNVVASRYQTTQFYLRGWIRALVEVRNICAHSGRIYNMPLQQSPKMYEEEKQYNSNRVFPVLIVMHRMLNGRKSWRTFYESLCGLMDEYSEAVLQCIGFPEEWRDILKP